MDNVSYLLLLILFILKTKLFFVANIHDDCQYRVAVQKLHCEKKESSLSCLVFYKQTRCAYVCMSEKAKNMFLNSLKFRD